jgi:hypothetical protein
LIALNVSDVADFLLAQPPASVDLVFGSPPYALKGGRYRNLPDGSFVPQTVSEWVRWMAMVVEQSCRISRGMVFFVVDSPRVQGEYNPAVEGLLWTLATDKQVVIRTPHVAAQRDCLSGDGLSVYLFGLGGLAAEESGAHLFAVGMQR